MSVAHGLGGAMDGAGNTGGDHGWAICEVVVSHLSRVSSETVSPIHSPVYTRESPRETHCVYGETRTQGNIFTCSRSYGLCLVGQEVYLCIYHPSIYVFIYLYIYRTIIYPSFISIYLYIFERRSDVSQAGLKFSIYPTLSP